MYRFKLVDYLKGFSVWSIVIFYGFGLIWPQWSPTMLVTFKGLGLQLLIALSGFCWYWSYLHKPLHFFGWIRRKLQGVYVPYALFVLLVFVLSLIVGVYQADVYTLLSHLFLYKMFHEGFIGAYGEALMWFSVWVQCYLFFHVFIALCKDLGKWKFLLFSIALSVLWELFVGYIGFNGLKVWDGFFLSYLWQLALGMAVADLLFSKKQIRLKKGIIGYFGAACFMFCALWMVYFPAWQGIIVDLPLFVLFAASGIGLYYIIGAKLQFIIRAYGKLFYGFLLWFFLAHEILLQIADQLAQPWLFLMALLLSSVLAYGFRDIGLLCTQWFVPKEKAKTRGSGLSFKYKLLFKIPLKAREVTKAF